MLLDDLLGHGLTGRRILIQQKRVVAGVPAIDFAQVKIISVPANLCVGRALSESRARGQHNAAGQQKTHPYKPAIHDIAP